MIWSYKAPAIPWQYHPSIIF